MAEDDLNKPLGQNKAKPRAGLPRFLPHALAGALSLSLGGFLFWAATADDPLGGEPSALVKVEPGVAAGKPAPAAPEPVKVTRDARLDAPQNTRTITIIDGSSGKREQVTIPVGAPQHTASVAAPAGATALSARLTENSRHGAIPKIAADGARPADVYARPVKLAANKTAGPRVAIVVSGITGASAAADALLKLPASVTFAFNPSGGNAEQLAARARKEGREVLLQVPMEPFDYPANDPGPQTLLTALDAAQNLDRLHWAMSRFQGYVGIANLQGARFTASETALAPVLREAAQRGLIYLDDGASPRSLAAQVAGANNAAFAKAEVTIDAVPTAAEIDHALARLEVLARERGSAIGITGAAPAAIERIARWARAAEKRGITLVPVSAVASRPKSS